MKTLSMLFVLAALMCGCSSNPEEKSAQEVEHGEKQTFVSMFGVWVYRLKPEVISNDSRTYSVAMGSRDQTTEDNDLMEVANFLRSHLESGGLKIDGDPVILNDPAGTTISFKLNPDFPAADDFADIQLFETSDFRGDGGEYKVEFSRPLSAAEQERFKEKATILYAHYRKLNPKEMKATIRAPRSVYYFTIKHQ